MAFFDFAKQWPEIVSTQQTTENNCWMSDECKGVLMGIDH